MLIELKVQNFAIIDRLHLQFREGLNILTGETGAGKSVLLKSLGLLMGLKSSPDMIRTGADSALVEGAFDLLQRPDVIAKLQAAGIPAEEPILIVKRILQSEKSRVYLNGHLSTLSQLRDVVSPLLEVGAQAEPLIEMTGQFENRDLLSADYQLDLLDTAAGLWDLRDRYSALFEQHLNLHQKKQDLLASVNHREQKLDYLKFQRKEIVDLDLSPGDDVNLESQIKRLRQLQKIQTCFLDVNSLLDGEDGGIQDRLQTALQKLTQIQGLGMDETLNSCQAALMNAREQTETAAQLLRKEQLSLQAEAENSDEKIEELESKFSRLRKLQKKYGPSVDLITAELLKIETEIAELEDSQTQLEKIQGELSRFERDLRELATQLHQKRVKAANRITTAVNQELLDLNMKGVLFEVSTTELPELSRSGHTGIEFQSRNSQKEPARSLAKFASGGELSRILLSIKRVVGSSRHPRTYLFDEVDTGVSGPTAEKVGRKLKAIAKGQQVLCVTHLAQVAAFADGHFRIQKNLSKGRAQMEVVELDASEKAQELARLISGEKISETSLQHARELMKNAQAQ